MNSGQSGNNPELERKRGDKVEDKQAQIRRKIALSQKNGGNIQIMQVLHATGILKCPSQPRYSP